MTKRLPALVHPTPPRKPRGMNGNRFLLTVPGYGLPTTQVYGLPVIASIIGMHEIRDLLVVSYSSLNISEDRV